MIVDCHTQVWDSAAWLGQAAGGDGGPEVRADTNRHLAAVDPVDHAIVLGFKSRYLSAEIPNDFVSRYVRRYASKMIGFAGIDPTDSNCIDELKFVTDELGLKGVSISPAMQDYHPSDTRVMRFYAACSERGLPLVVDHNLRSPASKMEYARPMLLDEVAREFPQLRIVLTHLGHPWIEEAIAVLGKHRHVYADIAGLLRRPWLAYNGLIGAYECGVIDKLLFGSDFPYRSPAASIESLYSINQLSYGTNLVTIPREQLRGIVERDALALLGIEHPRAISAGATAAILSDDD